MRHQRKRQGIIDAKSNAGVIIIEGACGSVRASTIAGSITVKQKELPQTAGITSRKFGRCSILNVAPIFTCAITGTYEHGKLLFWISSHAAREYADKDG